MSDLTLKQEAFVQAYIANGGNAAQAYRTAYNAVKMKDATVQNNAYKLLQRNEVATRIAAIRQKLAHDFEVSQSRVLEELAHIVFNDPRRFIAPDGSVKPMEQWDAGMAAAVSSISVQEIDGPNSTVIGRTTQVKFWNKNSAFTNMMKHLGMFERDNAQKNASPIAKLPREVQRLIYERLGALAGAGRLPALAHTGSSGSTD